MIEMLPDVYDWPIAVDNWEAKYGKASLCQRVPAQTSCARAISSSQWPRRLFSSGKLWRLEDVIAKLNVNYDSHLVINFFIGIDDKDSSSHIIHVGLGLWREGKCLFPPLWGMFIRGIKQPTIFKSDFCSMTSREVSASRLGISSPALAPLMRYVENRRGNSTLESSEF